MINPGSRRRRLGDADVVFRLANPPGPRSPPDRDDQTSCLTVPAMAVVEPLSVVGLPGRRGLLSALDWPNRPQGRQEQTGQTGHAADRQDTDRQDTQRTDRTRSATSILSWWSEDVGSRKPFNLGRFGSLDGAWARQIPTPKAEVSGLDRAEFQSGLRVRGMPFALPSLSCLACPVSPLSCMSCLPSCLPVLSPCLACPVSPVLSPPGTSA